MTNTSDEYKARFFNGMRFYAGGQENDYKQAYDKWWLPLAEDGYAIAQYMIGYMLQTSKGVAVSYTDAISWYEKAAEQGYAEAQHKLALVYNDGLGVPRDYSLAYFWSNLAIACYKEGKTISEETSEAFAREKDLNFYIRKNALDLMEIDLAKSLRSYIQEILTESEDFLTAAQEKSTKYWEENRERWSS